MRKKKLSYSLDNRTAESLLEALPRKPLFDLVITSPPYNLGKEYENRWDTVYRWRQWQRQIIDEIRPRMNHTGSLCYQVGNYVKNGRIYPLDIELDATFRSYGFELRNRIIWHFGHGLHCKNRFSGRYEVVLWYTLTDDYTFNLDPVRIPSQYPNKKHYKGPKKGQLSGNPLGKNPSDVWDIPNVKHNHPEKTEHPCQFPVALAERLILALSNPGDLVFDPFAGVASTGVAAALHGRSFLGCDPVSKYVRIGQKRIQEALDHCKRQREPYQS